MEFGESCEPDYIQDVLQQQVEEQSVVCDIKVIAKTWEKRYHLHVLIASPFFQHVFDHNFQEQSEGAVQMHIGTPATIDMALMFLYGKEPQLNIDNIGEVLGIAEFLLLPTLKTFCVLWLKKNKKI
ncbi:kelch-like protein 38 [Dreissena polymorpha]|uniref:kelch-like protein 38 n=1 Tax=Dreissena polymorpha TaxID=45954 RepID=UPI002263D4C7|nr:kelch-like protein 38 [Dreissena polymorpha]